MCDISVIVPVYNSEKYLVQCMDSVCSQTLKDVEIICVDDGSHDDSLRILKSYAEKDDRIVIIEHEKNAGLLKSWRDGIKYAHGKYIMFLDSDDELINDACEKLFISISKENVDMYQFGVEVVSDKGMTDLEDSYRVFLKPYTKKLMGDSVFDGLYKKRKYSWHVWNKIYRAEVCKKFVELTTDQYMILIVDVYASFYFAYNSKSSSGTKENFYRYHVDRGYTGSEKIINRILDNYKFSWVIDELSAFLKNEGKYDKYECILNEPPILPIESNMWLCRNIEDVESRNEAVQKICDLWSEKYPQVTEKSKKKCFSSFYFIYHTLYYLKYNGMKKTILRAMYRLRCRKTNHFSKV